MKRKPPSYSCSGGRQTDDLPVAAPDFNRRPENIYGRMEFHALSWPLECGLEQTFSVICTFTASPPSHTSPLSFLRHWRWTNISPPLSLFHPSFRFLMHSFSPFLSLFFFQYSIPSVIHIHIFEQAKKQCFGFVTFSNGFGSWIRTLDYGSDSSLFDNGFQDANKKLVFVYFCLFLSCGHIKISLQR